MIYLLNAYNDLNEVVKTLATTRPLNADEIEVLHRKVQEVKDKNRDEWNYDDLLEVCYEHVKGLGIYVETEWYADFWLG